MTDRAFGVEIEFCSDGRGREGTARLLCEAFDNAGIRRWNFTQRLGWDGSELELRTPILRGDDGMKKLELVMDTLDSAGCYTTSEDGMHVHHDAPEFINNIDLCIKLVKTWKNNQHIIYQFVDPERTRGYDGDDYDDYDEEYGHWACPEWSEKQIAEMERGRYIPGWSRNDLNLMSLPEHGSIEIRLHEGTLDFPEAESWILFGRRFIDRTASESDILSSTGASDLLKKVKVVGYAEEILMRKRNQMRGM